MSSSAISFQQIESNLFYILVHYLLLARCTMGKLLLGILFVFFIFVLSCTPPPPGGSGEDTALAGQAVAGRTTCKDTRVDTCVETEGSITYTMSGVFKTLTNFCSGKRVVD